MKKFILTLISGSMLLTACKKDNHSAPQTLTIQPGPNDGQDSYVYQVSNNPAAAGQNQNGNKELDIADWTFGGAEGTLRVFIKFNDLSKIPVGSAIVSAKLSLYGMSNSIQP